MRTHGAKLLRAAAFDLARVDTDLKGKSGKYLMKRGMGSFCRWVAGRSLARGGPGPRCAVVCSLKWLAWYRGA